jgi:hypothetical protein
MDNWKILFMDLHKLRIIMDQYDWKSEPLDK